MDGLMRFIEVDNHSAAVPKGHSKGFLGDSNTKCFRIVFRHNLHFLLAFEYFWRIC